MKIFSKFELAVLMRNPIDDLKPIDDELKQAVGLNTLAISKGIATGTGHFPRIQPCSQNGQF